LELRIELIDPADRPSAGGRILAEGMPEEVAAVEASHSRIFLKLFRII
jgi:excinuclease UvrABC ATPase subunit